MRHKTIGEQVKAWRAVRGLSQRALAERAGVVYPLVARLELGQTDLRLSTLERLAEALSIDVVDLLTGPPQVKRPAQRRARGR
jgi:transcriptional regulator with XRE-family HTH domain